MRTVLFVVLNRYADWEAAYLASALTMLGGGEYGIKTVSLSEECVESIGGFKTVPDYDVKSCPDDYAALILIGGLSWRNEEPAKVKPLVKDCLKKGGILGGICDAAAFLGAAGALNGVKHTGNDINDIINWPCSEYTNADGFIPRQAVRDGNVITANGTAPMEFAREVLLALNAAPAQKITEWYNFHKLGFYNAAMPEM